jgi:hypothetical protein
MSVVTRAGVAAVRTAIAVALALGGVAASSLPATASRLPACQAAQLRVVRDGTQGATGHAYLRFRITNTGGHTCRLYGYPTFRYRDAAGRPLGHRSKPAGVPAHVVRLAPGRHTRITLSYVNPGVTLPRQCHAARAASVTFRLASRPHVYQKRLGVRVCTTRKYRPTAYPVGF